MEGASALLGFRPLTKYFGAQKRVELPDLLHLSVRDLLGSVR